MYIHEGHRRLGDGDLATAKKMVGYEDKSICESCVKPKFLEVKKNENPPGMVIHADLRRPIQTKTLNENRYFLTLIYDYSRFTG